MGRAKKTAAKSKPEKPSGSGHASSSGSRADSPSPSPRSLVGNYALDSLPNLWDNDAAVRARMRADMNLVTALDEKGEESNSYVDATTANVALNAPVLLPIAKMMCQNDMTLPSIDRLIQSIDAFFQVAKRSVSLEKCYHEAWAIRRLISKLKRFLYRDSPPQDYVNKLNLLPFNMHACFVFSRLGSNRWSNLIYQFNILLHAIIDMLASPVHSMPHVLHFQSITLKELRILQLVEALGFDPKACRWLGRGYYLHVWALYIQHGTYSIYHICLHVKYWPLFGNSLQIRRGLYIPPLGYMMKPPKTWTQWFRLSYIQNYFGQSKNICSNHGVWTSVLVLMAPFRIGSQWDPRKQWCQLVIWTSQFSPKKSRTPKLMLRNWKLSWTTWQRISPLLRCPALTHHRSRRRPSQSLPRLLILPHKIPCDGQKLMRTVSK